MKKFVCVLMVIALGPPLFAQESKEDSRQMYEDVATMKILLKKAIEQSYDVGNAHGLGVTLSRQNSVLNSQWPGTTSKGTFPGSSSLVHPKHGLPTLTLEGYALEAYGVVYSVSLPQPLTDPLHVTHPPKEKPLTEWEQARQILRGEKKPTLKDVAKPVRPSLSEALLKVLAENGQHFSQLKPTDKVTIAITFSQHGCAQCHQVQSSMDKPLRSPSDPFSLKPRSDQQPTFRNPVSQPAQLALPKPDHWQYKAEEQSQMLLGDLHFKQKKYSEAIRAYQKALQSERSKLTPSRTSSKKQTEIRAHVAMVEILNRMAQAHLQLGQHEEARAALGNAAKVQQALILALNKEKGAGEDVQMKLPQQLIITASKQMLDDVGKGKIPFEEFRKKVTLKSIAFEKKKKQ